MKIELDIQGKRKYFNTTDVSLACVLFILFNFAFVFIYSFIPDKITMNRFVSYGAQFLIEFLFAVASWTVAKIRKVDLISASGMNKKFSGKMIGYGLLISLVCLMFFGSLSNVFIEFLYLCGYSSILSDIAINDFWTYLIYVIIICIAPAIFEELLFRGVVASGLKKCGEKIAIVVSALIFMLMHGNAEQTVHQFIIGLVVGYIFIKSGNLWIGVIVHFFNNFISVTMTYIASSAQMQTVEQVTTSNVYINPWLTLFIELLIGIFWAYVGYKLLKYLFKKVFAENEKLNLNQTTQIGENDLTSTILVDGEEREASVSISETDKEDEKKLGIYDDTSSKDAKEKVKLSVPCIIMFVLSGLYLLSEWILALLSGFGI